MGSGLILLVIVGAWLAVLVPMALRSQESNSLGTVDKFHDAMRVLSRRQTAVGPEVDGRDVAEADEQAGGGRRAGGRRVGGRSEGGSRAGVRSPADVRSGPAAQRRRILLALVAVALLSLVGALVGPRWLLVPHLVADVLIGAYVGYLRHETILRAERDRHTAHGERRPAGPEQRISLAAQASRQASRANSLRATAPLTSSDRATTSPRAPREGAGEAPRKAAREAPREAAGEAPRELRRSSRPAHIAGVPERLPSRATVTGARLVVTVDPTGDPAPVPARGAQGGAWSPVPVPLPIYLSEPAPRRAASDGVAAAERELGIDDQGPELEHILDRRRAVND